MIYRACILVPFLEDSIASDELKEIGEAIAARDPSLLWKPVRLDGASGTANIRLPTLPTMILQFHDLVPPPWPEFKGSRVESKRVHKVTQLRMMEEAGIPVPRWTRLERRTEIDPEQFGEFLIIKPTERGASLGRGVTLIRTADFERYRDEHAPTYEGYRRSPPIVQEFIFTGERPRQYRVLNFLGRVVLSILNESPKLTPFNAPVQSLAITEKVISVTTGLHREFVSDPDVIALNRRVTALFDASAVVGVDIVRSARTGALYVLEANMGNVWMLSNTLARSAQQLFGRETMKKQYGAIGLIAEAIIERARKELLR